MDLFRRVVEFLGKTRSPQASGDMLTQTGAGPAVAAHSKDAASNTPTGHNPLATAKKARVERRRHGLLDVD